MILYLLLRTYKAVSVINKLLLFLYYQHTVPMATLSETKQSGIYLFFNFLMPGTLMQWFTNFKHAGIVDWYGTKRSNYVLNYVI